MSFTVLNDKAVSPVVGVMLMLVVTIIIAAVVSAFGGGMIQNKDTASSASISGSYSQYNGLVMTHMGGDSLETREIRVIIRPSDEFGRGQGEFGQLLVNMSSITDAYGNRLIDPDYGTYEIMSWRAGESLYVVGGPDLMNSNIIGSKDYPPCYQTQVTGGKGNWCYVTSLNNQINIGKTVTLEIVDTDGQMISSSDMVIEA